MTTGALRLAHQFAIESANVTAEMVESKEFPDLATRFDLSSVPLTVVNGVPAMAGLLPEREYLDGILRVSSSIQMGN